MCWWSLPLEILRISRTLPVSACARPYMVNFSVISECITVQGWGLGFFGGRGGGVLVLPVQSLSESNLENQICHFSEKKKNKINSTQNSGKPILQETYIHNLSSWLCSSIISYANFFYWDTFLAPQFTPHQCSSPPSYFSTDITYLDFVTPSHP